MGQLALPLMLIGTAMSVAGTLAQGKVAQQQARMQAAQMREAAKLEDANSHRAATEERRQSDLVESRARAVGAASGAGDYNGLVEKIDAEGEYRALFALYSGQQVSTGIRNQAAMTEWEGAQAKRASNVRAASTLMSSAANMAPMAQKYGGDTSNTGDYYITAKGGSSRGYR